MCCVSQYSTHSIYRIPHLRSGLYNNKHFQNRRVPNKFWHPLSLYVEVTVNRYSASLCEVLFATRYRLIPNNRFIY